VVSTGYAIGEMPAVIGKEAYSYHFVAQAFKPLLERLGTVLEINRPESRLDYTLWRAQRAGRGCVHLSFLPIHMGYLSSRAPNVAFPSWEFPDIPVTNLGGNPRNNWARIARHFDAVICHSQCAKDAFRRAGVTTPTAVVPIPVPAGYFDLPRWQPSNPVVLNHPCFEFPQHEEANESLAATTARLTGLTWRQHGRNAYRRLIKPCIPAHVDRYVWYAARAAGLVRKRRAEDAIPCRLSEQAMLSGVVYTTVFNPFDPRKNWQDLLTAFLLTFANVPDVTLVMKLVLRPEMLRSGLLEVFEFYRNAGIDHACKVVIIWSYLSDREMLELTRASAYYVNTARAEGSCLPLQNFLAAGRPGLAPVHSGLADYFDENIGFVVQSHPEPAPFPQDPEKHLRTSWHRLAWSSLCEQLSASYRLVTTDYEAHHAMGIRARQTMADFASDEVVWPALLNALEPVLAARSSGRRVGA
jgi:glycosyltransferase involved in cell wall biosynthesis